MKNTSFLALSLFIAVGCSKAETPNIVAQRTDGIEADSDLLAEGDVQSNSVDPNGTASSTDAQVEIDSVDGDVSATKQTETVPSIPSVGSALLAKVTGEATSLGCKELETIEQKPGRVTAKIGKVTHVLNGTDRFYCGVKFLVTVPKNHKITILADHVIPIAGKISLAGETEKSFTTVQLRLIGLATTVASYKNTFQGTGPFDDILSKSTAESGAVKCSASGFDLQVQFDYRNTLLGGRNGVNKIEINPIDLAFEYKLEACQP